MARYFKMCHRCNGFFFSEESLRNHGCFRSNPPAAEPAKETPSPVSAAEPAKESKKEARIRMIRELDAEKGIKGLNTEKYEAVLAIYQQEFPDRV